MKVVSSLMPPTRIQEMIQTKFPEVGFEFYKGIKYAEEGLKDAEIFITYGDDLTEAHIHSAQKLKWIMVMSAGVDQMPLDACRKKGILVTNARGIHKIPMAEFTIGLMLQHVKQMRVLWENEIKEEWDRKVRIGELSGSTILILGVGAIGGEIARLAKAFGMKTIGINRSGRPVDFIDEIFQLQDISQVLPQADFVVTILPSTGETRNLITYEHFTLMKETAVFINIGRGDLVKEQELLQALMEKKIAHAYLDVFSEEPLPKEHPFWKSANVTVTPHISSLTKNYLVRSFEIFEHNLHTYIKKGDVYLNQIDLIRGY